MAMSLEILEKRLASVERSNRRLKILLLCVPLLLLISANGPDAELEETLLLARDKYVRRLPQYHGLPRWGEKVRDGGALLQRELLAVNDFSDIPVVSAALAKYARQRSDELGFSEMVKP